MQSNRITIGLFYGELMDRTDHGTTETDLVPKYKGHRTLHGLLQLCSHILINHDGCIMVIASIQVGRHVRGRYECTLVIGHDPRARACDMHIWS
jgi:hypothetical protein